MDVQLASEFVRDIKALLHCKPREAEPQQHVSSLSRREARESVKCLLSLFLYFFFAALEDECALPGSAYSSAGLLLDVVSLFEKKTAPPVTGTKKKISRPTSSAAPKAGEEATPIECGILTTAVRSLRPVKKNASK